jgi:hypothetical protein
VAGAAPFHYPRRLIGLYATLYLALQRLGYGVAPCLSEPMWAALAVVKGDGDVDFLVIAQQREAEGNPYFDVEVVDYTDSDGDPENTDSVDPNDVSDTEFLQELAEALLDRRPAADRADDMHADHEGLWATPGSPYFAFVMLPNRSVEPSTDEILLAGVRTMTGFALAGPASEQLIASRTAAIIARQPLADVAVPAI